MTTAMQQSMQLTIFTGPHFPDFIVNFSLSQGEEGGCIFQISLLIAEWGLSSIMILPGVHFGKLSDGAFVSSAKWEASHILKRWQGGKHLYLYLCICISIVYLYFLCFLYFYVLGKRGAQKTNPMHLTPLQSQCITHSLYVLVFLFDFVFFIYLYLYLILYSYIYLFFICICIICICICTQYSHFGSQGEGQALMGLSCPELRSLC